MSMPMHPDVARALEQIDAAMFSGDSFIAADNASILRSYLTRWDKELTHNENTLTSTANAVNAAADWIVGLSREELVEHLMGGALEDRISEIHDGIFVDDAPVTEDKPDKKLGVPRGRVRRLTGGE